MQGNRGRRDPFFDFGDPFSSFGSFGGFGPSMSLRSSFFGGRNPFDDSFFSHPFGGMFESNVFAPIGSPLPHMHPTGFIDHQAPEPRKNKGPIIEELNSDDEKDDGDKEKKENSNTRKHGRSNDEPHVEHPDDEGEEKKSRHLLDRNDYSRFNERRSQPQSSSFAFQNSSFSYGGANGVYHTSSKMRRTGSDGVTFEESREADSSTGQAKHRVFRGLHTKGHSLSRNLNSDGKVDSMQTLHNINEDELPGFEESWKGHAQKHLPGRIGSFNNYGGSKSGQTGQVTQAGWALPSTETILHSGMRPDSSDKVQASGAQYIQRMRTEPRDKAANHLGWNGVGRY